MSAIIHNNVQVQVRDHRVESARPVRVEPVRQTRPVRVDRNDYQHTHPIVVRPIVRPIVHPIVRPIVRPIVEHVYEPAPVYTSWTPAPSYTYQPAAIQVLAPTALANDQLTIDVSLGNATTLELDAAGGSTYVSQVTLISANGASQTIPVNQMLSAQNPSIPLSIDNCNAVTQIIVDGHSSWGGAVSIQAL